MICPSCGENISDESKFCAKCGASVTKIVAAEDANPNPTETAAAVAAGAPDVADAEGAAGTADTAAPADAPAPATAEKPARKRSRAPIIVAIIVAAAIIGGLAAFFISSAPKAPAIALTIVAPGYDEGSSPIPIRIKGKTDAGESVNRVGLFTLADKGIDLEPGTYKIAPAGSPVTSTGGIYSYDKKSIEVTVSDNPDKVGEETPSVTFNYAPIPVEDVTQDDIDAVKKWIGKSDMDEAAATSSIERLETSVEEATTIKTPLFEFKIPEYWRGKVEWEVSENTPDALIKGDRPLLELVKVYAKPGEGNPLDKREEILVVYTTTDNEYPYPGNVDTYNSVTQVNRNGVTTVASVTQWYNGFRGVGQADLDKKTNYLMDLQTGGKGTMPRGMYDAPGNFDLCKEFLNKELELTVYESEAAQTASDKAAKEAEEQARKAEEEAEEQARKAEEERVAQIEADKQAAYTSNPGVVEIGEEYDTFRYTMTGVVRTGIYPNAATGSDEKVYWLELPQEVEVTGSKYGDVSGNKIIIGSDFAQYIDEVVSINMGFGIRSTANIAEAQVSVIWATNPELARDFRH